MRKVLRFFEIVIVGTLLTVFVLARVSSNMILDKNTVKKELDEAGIYKEISSELRKTAHEELDQVFSKYPQINVDLDELLDKTLTDDILREETNFILDSIYNFEDKIVLEPKIIIDGYRNNLNKYLEEKNITLPQEINDNIDRVLNTEDIQKIDLSEYTDEFNDYVHDYKQVINIIHVAIYVVLITALIIMGFSVIVSKEKLKVVYKPLIFAGVALLIIRACGNILFDALILEANEKTATNFINAARKVLFGNLNIYIAIFLIIGLGLMIYKIVKDKNKTA